MRVCTVQSVDPQTDKVGQQRHQEPHRQ
jgi:hypothetical protein